MKRFMTFIFIFLAGLAISAFLIYTLNSNADKNQTGSGQRRGGGGSQTVAVEVTQLKTGNMFDEGRFVGSIEPASKFMVASKISGRLKKLFVDIGDSITNGATIVTMDDEELVLSITQAEADIEIARANYNESAGLLEISQSELARVKTMRQQKVSSVADVEAAEAAHKTKQARHQVNKALLSQKEAALLTAKLKLAYATVDASWSGGANQRFIAERFQDEGAMITANTPIVSVIDIATVTAVIDVVERDYFKMKIGMMAEIETSALPVRTYPARVSRIAPLLNELSRQARIELELKNVDFSLKPGMFVRARLIYGAHNSVTVAPVSALVRRNEQDGIFLIDREKNIANFVPVTIGFKGGELMEIASPTLSGEVITLGQHLVEDGASVRVAGDESPKAEDEGRNRKKGGQKQ